MKILRTFLSKVLLCTVALHLAIASGGTVLLAGCTRENDGSDNTKPVDKPSVEDGQGGYLFAHMTNANYGSLFYSISRDGLSWKTLNGGKVILESYYGGDLAPIYFTGADSDISLIDVIIRKFNGKYYAIMKDERWEDKAPKTHKSIRIASSDNLLGPYSNPGPSVSPNWREAPIIIRTPEGKFRLYYENYGEHVYEMREALAIQGAPWKDATSFYPPKDGRHGCIIYVDEETYRNIEKSYK